MAERPPKKKRSTPARKSTQRNVRSPKVPDTPPSFTVGEIGDTVAAPANPVLYIEIDEEIPSIIDRLRSMGAPDVHLVVPKRAVFLESLVNVKLLKREADALGVQLTLVSTDRKAQHLAKQVGLPIVRALPTAPTATASMASPETASSEEERAVLMQPLQKSDAPAPSVPKHRMSLNEILARRRAKPATEIQSLDPREPIPQVALVSGSPNRRLFLFFLTLCTAALVVVAYFVLPKATVLIELESRVEEVADRIILADAERNAAEFTVRDTTFVPTKPVSVEQELTKTYPATGIVSTGSNAQGIMTITNDAGTSQPLIAATRFRSPDGIIFRLQAPVSIPGRSSIDALVVADPTDESGKLVGERGNLPAGTAFTLPGLTGSNRTLVSGKNNQPFAGGVTKASRSITQADTEAARKDLLDTLRASATEELKKKLAETASSGGAPFYLAEAPELLTFTRADVELLDGARVDAQTDQFRAVARVRLEGIAYDRAAVRTILDRKVAEIIHPDQRIAATDEAGLKIDIVLPRDPREERQGRVRANATLRYRLEYTLSDALKATVQKRILGDSLPEAERYIQSLEQVGQSQISTWPFWVHRIPGIASSVEVVPVSNIDED